MPPVFKICGCKNYNKNSPSCLIFSCLPAVAVNSLIHSVLPVGARKSRHPPTSLRILALIFAKSILYLCYPRPSQGVGPWGHFPSSSVLQVLHHATCELYKGDIALSCFTDQSIVKQRALLTCLRARTPRPMFSFSALLHSSLEP